MLSASDTTMSNPVVAGPDRPKPDDRRRFHRLAAPAVVLSATALLVVGIANVQVARERTGVEGHLSTARAVAARVPEHLATGDGEAVAADLDLLIRSANSARTASDGLSWRLATRADFNRTQVRAVRRDSQRAATLAAAATPLRTALTPLRADDTKTLDEPDDQNQLNDLDDLARGLSRYAGAARLSFDPAVIELERAAVAAGLLPALAGSEGPRHWTVCRAATGPCLRTTVTAAVSGASVPVPPPGTATPPGRHWVAGVDVLVVGIDSQALFPQPGSWDAAAAFHLLYHLDPSPKVPLITVRSAIGTEQQAIDGLARPQW